MSQSWILKKGSEEKTILSKFPEQISFENPPSVLYMYNKEEEIIEKDEINSSDEKVAFIRKKKKRRSLRAKTSIHLEEPLKGNPVLDFERINVEGNIVDSSVEGVSSSKYALLQVVKKNGSVDPSNMISKSIFLFI